MIFPIKLVYVAGPIKAATKAEHDANVARGREAGVEIWKMGAVAIVPHLNTMDMDHDGVPAADIYLGDLEVLKRCDAMFLLADRWYDSQGCNYEVAWAHHRGIQVCEDMDDLRAWLRK